MRFTEKQKFLTQNSCRDAELRAFHVNTEPNSAAIVYHRDRMDSITEKNYLIFDHGEGKFDVGVLITKDKALGINTIA